jgi:hypothetical protein
MRYRARPVDIDVATLSSYSSRRGPAPLLVPGDGGLLKAQFIGSAQRSRPQFRTQPNAQEGLRTVLLVLFLVMVSANWNCAGGGMLVDVHHSPVSALTSGAEGSDAQVPAWTRVRVTVQRGDESMLEALGSAWAIEVSTEDEVVLIGCVPHPVLHPAILRLEIVASCRSDL